MSVVFKNTNQITSKFNLNTSSIFYVKFEVKSMLRHFPVFFIVFEIFAFFAYLTSDLRLGMRLPNSHRVKLG